MPSKTQRFPAKITKNGRVGKIYLLGNGTYKTHFNFAHKAHQNTFTSYDRAREFLNSEFDKLDSDLSDTQTQFPLSRDRKHYHELEQRLKSETENASMWQAVDFYIAHHKRKKLVPATVKDCAEKFIQSRISSNLSSSQIKNLRKHCGRFSKVFGARKIDSIDSHEIENWLNSQKDRNGKCWEPKTRKNYRGSLVALSLYARKTLRAIPMNGEETEFQKVPLPRMTVRGKVEIYTPVQIERILSAALKNDVELIPIIVLGAFMGLRPAESHGEDVDRSKLKWEDFIWSDGMLELIGQKVRSKSSRLVPIPKNANLWLKPFRDQRGAIWKLKKAFDRRFKKVLLQAGLRGIYDGLRHSYASYQLRILKGDIARLAHDMGNTEEEIYRSYRKSVTDSEAKKWFSVAPPAEYEKMMRLSLNQAHPKFLAS